MKALALCFALLAPGALAEEAGAQARAALGQLAAAAQLLEDAGSARDRIRALTATVNAFEAGLSSLRSGLRTATLREDQLTRGLAAREEQIAALLGTLQAMGDRRAPQELLHPAGPTGSARAGMILADLTPALNKQAAELRLILNDLRALRRVQQEAEQQLATGLGLVQDARTALSQAMAERTALPTRFTEDPVKTAILIASAQNLDGFIRGLAQISPDLRRAPAPAKLGDLPLPARGLILRRAGEADAAGITRPGLLLATRPGALVTAPSAATIRYQGPLLDFGQVLILEPAPSALIILAGLGEAYAQTGEIVSSGAPLGLMGGLEPNSQSIDGEGAGAARSETLYIETRENNVPLNPELWFRAHKEG